MSWSVCLTVSSLGQVSRLQLISQTPDLVVGHGQPTGTLLQVSLQPGTLPLHAARLAGQMPGLGLEESGRDRLTFDLLTEDYKRLLCSVPSV